MEFALLGLSQPGARPDVPAVRQAIQVRQQGQGSKGAKATEGGANYDRVVIFMMLAHRDRAPATSKWVVHVICIDVLFSRETEFTKFVSEEAASDPAATVTKHEPGLLPSCRVVSYGSGLSP